MIRIVLRVAFLWAVLTIGSNFLFGINQWQAIFTLVRESTPQVEAFLEGLGYLGWKQLPVVLLGFFYRRAVILAVKKVGTFIAYVLLERHWRRQVSSAMALPGYYTARGFDHIRSWHELQDRLLLRPWFLTLYTTIVLFVGTLVSVEILLAWIRGTLGLPPLVVKYQAVGITFIFSFFAATIAQYVLLFLWGVVYRNVPQPIHDWIDTWRMPTLRRLVHLRAVRRVVTRALCSRRGFYFSLAFLFCILWPF